MVFLLAMFLKDLCNIVASQGFIEPRINYFKYFRKNGIYHLVKNQGNF